MKQPLKRNETRPRKNRNDETQKRNNETPEKKREKTFQETENLFFENVGNLTASTERHSDDSSPPRKVYGHFYDPLVHPLKPSIRRHHPEFTTNDLRILSHFPFLQFLTKKYQSEKKPREDKTSAMDSQLAQTPDWTFNDEDGADDYIYPSPTHVPAPSTPMAHSDTDADAPTPPTTPTTPSLGIPQPNNNNDALKHAVAEFLALSSSSHSSSISIRGVARKWGVNHVTLHRHVRRHNAIQYRAEHDLPPVSPFKRRGKKQKLGKRIEDALAKWIQILESLCYPILLNKVIAKANEIGTRVYGSDFSPVTYEWWREFKRRYSHLKLCATKHPKSTSLAKLIEVNPKVVDDFFDKLEHIYESKGFDVKPHRVFNVDETGVALSDDASGLRVVGFRNKTTQVIDFKQSSAHYMSAICTVGATQEAVKVPPYLVIKGARDPGRRVLFGSDAPEEFEIPGIEYTMSESGFATAAAFGEYLLSSALKKNNFFLFLM